MVTQLFQPDAVVLDGALVSGVQIEVAANRVVAVHRDQGAAATAVAGILLPGLVDLQVNGAGGCSVQDATPEVLDVVARTVGRQGAVGFLPTLITSPFDALLEQVRGVAAWIEGFAGGLADAVPLGMHVEGPFLLTPGAHAAADLVDPTPERIERLLEAGGGHIRLVTLAPSRAGAPAAVARLREAGVCVSLGHGAGAAGVAECVAAGATMATHLFNAMGAWSHRDPGMPGTILDSPALRCGMILDGIHVHDTMVRLAARCLGPDRFVLVTDCVSAMGMPDGDYTLAEATVTLRDGAVRNADGTLAGSALTMFGAAANLLRIVPGADAVWLAAAGATNPAALIGQDERFGRIAPGTLARWTRLGPDGDLSSFFG